MNGNETYGPTPLKLEAFDSTASITGIITKIVEKRFDNGPRWIITVDDDWTLIVNDTNYRAVKKGYGAESVGWLQKPVTAFKGTLYARGVEREGICLRVPQEPDAKDAEDLAPAALPPDKLDAANAELRAANADKLDDDIPF